MKILFLMRHFGYIRNYKPVLDRLSKQGHTVILAFNNVPSVRDKFWYKKLFKEISCEIGVIESADVPLRDDLWTGLATFVRYGLDYVRYFDPRYKDAHKLRKRAEKKLPVWGSNFFNKFHPPFFIKFLIGCGLFIEKIIPPNKQIKRFIASHNPDIILVTPYIDLKSDQVDYVKCAKSLNIKTAYCVHSWDNLTNKGIVKEKTDKIIVWNERQREEAATLHGINPDDVIVTGAQCYDHWFNWSVSTSLDAFCSQAGLKVSGNFLLYLGSSPFIAPDEVSLVKKWIREVRNSKNEKINQAPIVIRPHPQHAEQWNNVDFSPYDNIVVYPLQGENPVDKDTRSIYFDSIYHSFAVVGVNTSAMIEAGILEKPVFTILTEEMRNTQEGTLHFHHLVEGGLLYIASDFTEHIAQLEQVLLGGTNYKKQIRKFVNDFIRPNGMDRDATPIFIDQLQQFNDKKRRRSSRDTLIAKTGSLLMLILLLPLAIVATVTYSKKTHLTKESKKRRSIRKFIKRMNKKPVIAAIVRIVSNMWWCVSFIPKYFLLSLRYVRLYGTKKTVKLYAYDLRSRLTSDPLHKDIKRLIQKISGKIPGGPTRKTWLYHDYVIPGMIQRSHRKNNYSRLRKIWQAHPCQKKKILDIGCSAGGITFGLALMGAKKVYGVDYDAASIRLAKKVAKRYNINNVEFHVADLDQYEFPKVNGIVWLSNWMWIVKQHGIEHGKKLLREIPEKTGAQFMIFESAANDGKAAIPGMTQKKIKKILQECSSFQKIIDLNPFEDKWRKKGKERNVFLCKGPKVIRGKKAIIRRIDNDLVVKEYQQEALWAKEREAECLKRLADSPFFPRVVGEGENWIKMEWVGEKVQNVNELKQLDAIVKILEENNIVHRDICPENLLYHNNKLSLIDFEWAVLEGQDTPIEPPLGLGRGFYEHGKWSDSQAAEKVKQFFIGKEKA